MINFEELSLPILISDEHQVLIDKVLENIPEDAGVIHDYTELTAFIQTVELELEPQLSDPKREPIVVTSMENFEIGADRHSAETQYWIFEIEIAFEQGNWSIVNILCEQVPEPSTEDRVSRLLG